MGICDICGRKTKTRKVRIEGAVIEACYKCVPGKERDVVEKKRQCKPKQIKEEDVVEQYNKIIKTAREEKGISVEDLAKKLNISLSYLRHIEKRDMIPDKKTAKKLERFLNIKLFEEIIVEEEEDVSDKASEAGFTLGDQAEWE